MKNNVYDNAGGVWQSGANWSNGTPGTLDTTVIGLGASAPFTLTTGTAAVATGALVLFNDDALLRITSATTIGPYPILDLGGTLEVTSGQTLFGTSLRAPGGTILVDANAVLNLTGHQNFGSGPSSYVASVDGTLAVANTNTVGVAVSGGTLVVTGGTIAAGGTLDTANGSYSGGGSFTIGQDGPGTPAQVVVTGTAGTPAVVTDTYCVLSSDLVSAGDLTLNGAVSWTDAGDTGDATPRGYMLVGNNNLAGNLPDRHGTGTVRRSRAAGRERGIADRNQLRPDRQFVGQRRKRDHQIRRHLEHRVRRAGHRLCGVRHAGSADRRNGRDRQQRHLHRAFARGRRHLLVYGPGALLTTDGGFADGKGGQGVAGVLNGGTIALTGTSGISVGQSAGSSGTLIVGNKAAAASAFLTFGTAASGMTVGGSGAGTLEVLSDGTVNMNGTGGISVGQSSLGGALEVSGPGAFLQDGGLVRHRHRRHGPGRTRHRQRGIVSRPDAASAPARASAQPARSPSPAAR